MLLMLLQYILLLPQISNPISTVYTYPQATDSRPSGRPQRRHVPPARLQDYVLGRDDDDDNDLNEDSLANFCMFVDCDPVSFQDAAADEKWIQAMKEEIHSIEKNETWELTTLPIGKKPIGVKWVYKTKYKPDGKVDRYKARLAAKGYKQKPRIDYFEVFAPVSRMCE